MGRKGSGLTWYSKLQGDSPHPCRLRPASIGSEWTSIWNLLTHTGHMEFPNWVASCAVEIEAILPYLTGIQWDSAWATHDVSIKAYAWKTCSWVRWAPWPYRELLPLVVPSGLVCVVLSDLYPYKVDYWFESLRHLRIWVMTCSPHLNVELPTS
jgi:hypothetical protein